MKAEWKIRGYIDTNNVPLVIATIRTEHEIILSPETIQIVEKGIDIIADTEEMAENNYRFVLELKDILSLYYYLSDIRFGKMALINTEWESFEGRISLETLIKLRDSLNDVNSFRIEGNPKSGMFMVFSVGSDIIKKTATEATLQNALVEFEKIKNDPLCSAVVATWIGLAVAGISVGIEAWRLFREEQDRARRKEENERQELEKERIRLEKESQKATHSYGGPAARDALERVGKIC